MSHLLVGLGNSGKSQVSIYGASSVAFGSSHYLCSFLLWATAGHFQETKQFLSTSSQKYEDDSDPIPAVSGKAYFPAVGETDSNLCLDASTAKTWNWVLEL